ncbi:MAG: hypothetical protein NTU80_01965 [Verrucomicrobia bacterium]|nr:hypothetical protein [Verrucomicrobiota bacterium]
MALVLAPNPGLRAAAPMTFSVEERTVLLNMARKYIWWMQPEEALCYPARVIAQVMNLGVFEDAFGLLELLGADRLVDVLCRAEAGQFSPESWHFWHYRLDLVQADEPMPPLLVRHIP